MGSISAPASGVPVSVSVAAAGLSSTDFDSPDGNTLDEPVLDTVKRDLRRIAYNVKVESGVISALKFVCCGLFSKQSPEGLFS